MKCEGGRCPNCRGRLTLRLENKMYFHDLILPKNTMLARRMEMKLLQRILLASIHERSVHHHLHRCAQIHKLGLLHIRDAERARRPLVQLDGGVNVDGRLESPEGAVGIGGFVEAGPVERTVGAAVAKGVNGDGF